MSHPLIAKFVCCVHKILVSRIGPVFMRVPSHGGLASNLAADTAAKAALKAVLLKPVSNLTLPHSDPSSL